MSDPEEASSTEQPFNFKPDAVDVLAHDIIFGMFDGYFNTKVRHEQVRSVAAATRDFRIAVMSASEVDDARHKIESTTTAMDMIVPRKDGEGWFDVLLQEYTAALEEFNQPPNEPVVQ